MKVSVNKECFKCHVEKPINEFYKHPQMKDGRLNKCKECNKKDVRQNRKNNIEHYRAYDRNRGSRTTAEYLREYRKKNRQKNWARARLNYHIRNGNMSKKPCEVCGSTEWIHGHHDDYSKPLDVRWLCPVHHAEVHAKQ